VHRFTRDAGKWAIVGVIVVKLLLMPIIGIAMVWTANRWGLLPDDPIFPLSLALQASAPSATALVRHAPPPPRTRTHAHHRTYNALSHSLGRS
jgi:hypothetical protein